MHSVVLSSAEKSTDGLHRLLWTCGARRPYRLPLDTVRRLIKDRVA
ncbi:hypothetical protein RHOER0001_3270 [Rhodococcus erythropolis SK121]|nr:hypothetical protein RHOER0001_3270 [Rhodococcus erythropolis SK121]